MKNSETNFYQGYNKIKEKNALMLTLLNDFR